MRDISRLSIITNLNNTIMIKIVKLNLFYIMEFIALLAKLENHRVIILKS